MERRYLVATLALVATFAIFSREFRSGHLANLPCPRAALQAEIACAKHYLADQLVAKVRPFVDRGVPEEQQMVAELNLPVLAAANEKVAEMQAQVAQQTPRELRSSDARAGTGTARPGSGSSGPGEKPPCRRTRSGTGGGIERRARSGQEMNVRTALRAQEVSARAIERAQRAIERSRWKMHAVPIRAEPRRLLRMPIDFEFNFPSDFDQQVQAAVDSRLAVKCVRTKVAAQQFRTVMMQRANQNMRNNVDVVVSTQDVSGLSALTHSPASHTALHQIEHERSALSESRLAHHRQRIRHALAELRKNSLLSSFVSAHDFSRAAKSCLFFK